MFACLFVCCLIMVNSDQNGRSCAHNPMFISVLFADVDMIDCGYLVHSTV